MKADIEVDIAGQLYICVTASTPEERTLLTALIRQNKSMTWGQAANTYECDYAAYTSLSIRAGGPVQEAPSTPQS